jgi:hypothetical protein
MAWSPIPFQPAKVLCSCRRFSFACTHLASSCLQAHDACTAAAAPPNKHRLRSNVVWQMQRLRAKEQALSVDKGRETQHAVPAE